MYNHRKLIEHLLQTRHTETLAGRRIIRQNTDHGVRIMSVVPRPKDLPDMGALRLSDANPEEEDMSPRKPDRFKSSPLDPQTQDSKASTASRNNNDTREDALRAELTTLRSINNTIEAVLSSLQKARQNMDTVHRTVSSASTLLKTWTRILSQTEHNQRLVLNPNWRGSTQDIADMENEVLARQREEQSRELEERERSEEGNNRRGEEEDRRRDARPATTGPGRGRGGGLGRGARKSVVGSVSGTGRGSYTGVGGQGGRGISRGRPGSGVARGSGTVRERDRGR